MLILAKCIKVGAPFSEFAAVPIECLFVFVQNPVSFHGNCLKTSPCSDDENILKPCAYKSKAADIGVRGVFLQGEFRGILGVISIE